MIWEKLILLIEKIFSSITKTENVGKSMLEVSKFKLHHYNIMEKISIHMLYYVISDISNLIIKLSHELRSICVMGQ